MNVMVVRYPRKVRKALRKHKEKYEPTINRVTFPEPVNVGIDEELTVTWNYNEKGEAVNVKTSVQKRSEEI